MVIIADAYIEKNGSILLRREKEKTKSPFPLMFTFPGGAMEIDETPEQAVVREVKEETGYDVKVIEYLAGYTAEDDVIKMLYRCEITGGQKLENEVLELLTLEEILNPPERISKESEGIAPPVYRYLEKMGYKK